MRYPLTFCLLFFSLLPLPVIAAQGTQTPPGQEGTKTLDEAAIEKRLHAIQKQVAALRRQLNTASAEEKKLLDELQAQDQRINRQHQKIRALQQRLQQTSDRLAAVQKEIDHRNRQIRQQKQEMTELLKLAVYSRHDLGLKRLLLSDSSRVSDLAGHQIRYLQHRLYALVREIAEQLKQLESLQQQLSAQQALLKTQQQALLAEQARLQQQRQQRQFVLQAVRDKMRADKNEIHQLDKNRQRLDRLLKELKNLLDDLPDDLGNNTRFARLKGRLPKPVAGRLLHSYGSVRGRERQRWEGLVFAATVGAPVKAVAYGRVAFADWLRGYGLLVVLDHGDGYMTLYGHNEGLLVEPGDWVQAGDTIALAGNSGSLEEPAVYFELRHDARPLNPKSWLKR